MFRAVVATMTEYDLLRDDAEALGELAVWPGDIDPASKIQSKARAHFKVLFLSICFPHIVVCDCLHSYSNAIFCFCKLVETLYGH